MAMDVVKEVGGLTTTVRGKSHLMMADKLDFSLLDPDGKNPRQAEILVKEGKAEWTADEMYEHYIKNLSEVEDTRALMRSIEENGDSAPLIVEKIVVNGQTRYRVRDGNRRWCGLRWLRETKEVWTGFKPPVYIIPASMTEQDIQMYLCFIHGDKVVKPWAAFERGRLFVDLSKTMSLSELAAEFGIRTGIPGVQLIIDSFKDTDSLKEYTKEDTAGKFSQVFEMKKSKSNEELLQADPVLKKAALQAIATGKVPNNKDARKLPTILQNEKAKEALTSGTGKKAFAEAIKVIQEDSATIGIFAEAKRFAKNRIGRNNTEITKVLRAKRKNSEQYDNWSALVSAVLTVSDQAGFDIDSLLTEIRNPPADPTPKKKK